MERHTTHCHEVTDSCSVFMHDSHSQWGAEELLSSWACSECRGSRELPALASCAYSALAACSWSLWKGAGGAFPCITWKDYFEGVKSFFLVSMNILNQFTFRKDHEYGLWQLALTGIWGRYCSHCNLCLFWYSILSAGSVAYSWLYGCVWLSDSNEGKNQSSSLTISLG